MSISRLAIVLLSSAAYTCAAPIVFNFGTDTAGTVTTFTNTVSGLSATFSSPYDPGGFAVEPTFFTTLPGNVLIDGLINPDVDIPLTIVFSTPLEGVSLLFATNVAGPFQLQAYNGASLVGTVTASGTAQPSGFPEGSISFSDGSFNRVVLTSATAPAFAIDDVAATVVPEPSSLFLIGSGLGLSAFIRRWLGSKGASRK